MLCVVVDVLVAVRILRLYVFTICLIAAITDVRFLLPISSPRVITIRFRCCHCLFPLHDFFLPTSLLIATSTIAAKEIKLFYSSIGTFISFFLLGYVFISEHFPVCVAKRCVVSSVAILFVRSYVTPTIQTSRFGKLTAESAS